VPNFSMMIFRNGLPGMGRDAPRSAFVVEEPVWVNVSDPTVHVNGDHAQYLDRTLRCRHVAGPPYVADDESLEVRWFLLADLPTMRPSLQERIVTAVEHVGAGGDSSS
jgi:hypothetical protein